MDSYYVIIFHIIYYYTQVHKYLLPNGLRLVIELITLRRLNYSGITLHNATCIYGLA